MLAIKDNFFIFDKVDRSYKKDTILAIAYAIYNLNDDRKKLEESLITLFNIFRVNGSGSYTGESKEFLSHYTPALDFGVIQSSSLESGFILSDLAKKMVVGDISSKEYISIVMLNYIQIMKEKNNKIVHLLLEILKIMKELSKLELNLNEVTGKEYFDKQEYTRIAFKLLGSTYFFTLTNDILKFNTEYDIDKIMSICNIAIKRAKEIGIDVLHKNQEEYSKFLTFDNLNIKVENSLLNISSQNKDIKLPYQKIVYGAPGTGKSYSLYKESNKLFKRKILLEKEIDNNYWVVTCGENNWAFEEFKKQNIFSIGWEEIKNVKELSYKELEKNSVDIYKTNFAAKQLNILSNKIKIGDILLVRQGTKDKKIVGYGVVINNYYEKEIRDSSNNKFSDFFHNIKVEWKDFSPITLENYPKQFQRVTIYKASPELIKEFEKIILPDNPSNFEEKEISTLERVTFYDGYTYGQFVGMYKPTLIEENDIGYSYIPGPFMRQLILALKNPNDIFCLIIEEINRAKADKVFGNIFQLLDRDSSGKSRYPISISEEQYKFLETELEEQEEEILAEIKEKGLYIPNNLYIWATMNSADEGVQPLDTAFKRRWKFEYISLNKNEKEFEKQRENIKLIVGQNKIYNLEWNTFRKTINNKLQEYNITEDRLISPFFISPNDFTILVSEDTYALDKNIFVEKVLMYIFDDLLRHYPKIRNEIFKDNMKTFSKIYEALSNDNSELDDYYRKLNTILSENLFPELFKEEENVSEK